MCRVVKPSLAVDGPQTHSDDFVRLGWVMCIPSRPRSGELDDATDGAPPATNSVRVKPLCLLVKAAGARDAPREPGKSDDFGLTHPNNSTYDSFFLA
jgi:hypothetical protein